MSQSRDALMESVLRCSLALLRGNRSCRSLVQPNFSPRPYWASFFLPPHSFSQSFFTPLHFNDNFPSTVPVPFFPTKIKKKPKTKPLRRNNLPRFFYFFFFFLASDLCSKHWLWSHTYECSGKSGRAVPPDTRPDLEPQNPLAAHSSSHSAAVTW